MIRIAICDDNIRFLNSFNNMLIDVLQSKKVSVETKTYLRCNLMLSRHKSNPFDVVFLDIDMPDVDGFLAAKELTKQNANCYIIFVSCHTELVYDSFVFRPLNFIVKEHDDLMRIKLETVINQLVEQMVQDEYIVIDNKEQGRISFRLRDIVYIESCDHYVMYHLNNSHKIIKAREKLTELENRLGYKSFVRIHKKYLVNLRYVFNIDLTGEAVILKDKNELPVSRNYKHNVDKELTAYLRRPQ